ncbi:MAG: hypothetical protein P4N24_19420, partial [Acidobacteriota bacterium]|nr:hypothetical protein [Acidobacteriota bacterium]
MKLLLQHGRSRVSPSLRVGGLGLLFSALAIGAALTSAQPQGSSPEPRAQITFTHDIAPIFQKNCIACHGSDKPQGGLRLDSEGATLKGGESGKVVIPGDSEKSPLIKRLVGVGEDARMPIGADPLPASQIKLIRAWIDQNSFAILKEPVQAQVVPVAAHLQAGRSGDFASDIRPILAARCYQCHGPELQQNGLRLDSLA